MLRNEARICLNSWVYVKDGVNELATDLKGLMQDDKNIGAVIFDRTADVANSVVDHPTETASGRPKGSPQV